MPAWCASIARRALAYSVRQPDGFQEVDPISPIKAIRDGWGLRSTPPVNRRNDLVGWDDRGSTTAGTAFKPCRNRGRSPL